MAVEDLDLGSVAPFVAVAEGGDLDRAARQVSLSRAELQSRLRLLERQVGAPLWERLEPVAELTPAGARFLVEARALVTQAVRLDAAVRPAVGRLRVHLGANASSLIESLISSFTVANPGVSTDRVEGPDNEAEAAVLDGQVDVAVTVGGRQLPTTIVQVTVERSPLGVVCPADHPLVGRADLRWTDLASRRLVFPSPGRHDAWSIAVRAALHRAGVGPVDEVSTPAAGPPQGIGVDLANRRAILVATAGLAGRIGPDVAWVPLHPTQTLARTLCWHRDAANPVTGMFAAWVASRSDAAADPESDQGVEP